jgi:hypothetical protein
MKKTSIILSLSIIPIGFFIVWVIAYGWEDTIISIVALLGAALILIGGLALLGEYNDKKQKDMKASKECDELWDKILELNINHPLSQSTIDDLYEKIMERKKILKKWGL